jgi:hypothetical protein
MRRRKQRRHHLPELVRCVKSIARKTSAAGAILDLVRFHVASSAGPYYAINNKLLIA